jgi:chromosome segregation ATPase
MVQQVKHPDEADADLGKPGELLSLDVASYAAGLASDSENGQSTERRISDTSWDDRRPHTLAELPPIETLREIEAWFVAQDARTRSNSRVLAELQAARADAEARADSLALELEVAQKALHSALCRVEDAKRADFAAAIDKLHAELAERDAVITHLKAEHTAQSTAFEELAQTRSREQQSHVVGQEEARAAAETLAAEIRALEERYRRSTAEFVAAREEELAQSRAARTALAETLRTVQTNALADAARLAELEALATDLRRALQAQIEATKHANASTEIRARELADERSRASALEAQLQAAMRHATDLSGAQSTETELRMHLEQLAASQDRLDNFEREARYQSEWLANLQVELAHAEVRAEQAEASRRPVENELGRARTELQRETERAQALDATRQELALELDRVRTELRCESERTQALDATQQELTLELDRVRTELRRETERAQALDATQRELVLELQRTRDALDESEFQLRRLEREANTSVQALSRGKVGIERGNSNPPSETLEFPDDGATLVPLDDSDEPAVPLGRHTTIGRARESDLRLKDSSVSRRHAVLTIEPNGAFIEDLRSVNGVTVNGQRIRHARVSDGDVIELGVKRFRFTSPAAGRNARNAL